MILDMLVRSARLAEDAGFEFALISGHHHPLRKRRWSPRGPLVVPGGGAEADASSD
jgi:hypothetical protein